MTDPYWSEHRQSYIGVSELFEGLALAQHEEHVRTAVQSDCIREGFALDSTDDRFPVIARWIVGKFGIEAPSRVELRPDPWKSPGAWRLYVVHGVSGFETYVWTDDVRKLGAP